MPDNCVHCEAVFVRYNYIFLVGHCLMYGANISSDYGKKKGALSITGTF